MGVALNSLSEGMDGGIKRFKEGDFHNTGQTATGAGLQIFICGTLLFLRKIAVGNQL